MRQEVSMGRSNAAALKLVGRFRHATRLPRSSSRNCRFDILSVGLNVAIRAAARSFGVTVLDRLHSSRPMMV
jgi:hypothetical protein